jgi:hypothetical protein
LVFQQLLQLSISGIRNPAENSIDLESGITFQNCREKKRETLSQVQNLLVMLRNLEACIRSPNLKAWHGWSPRNTLFFCSRKKHASTSFVKKGFPKMCF